MSASSQPGTTNIASRQIARAAGTVTLAYVIGQLIGLVRLVLVSRAFGTSAALDSFYAANRVTDLLFNLVAGGALASAFVPTFTGFLSRDDRAGAWKLASAVFNWLLIVLSAVSLIAAFYAPQIVRHGLFLIDPGQKPGVEELTIQLLRIQLPAVAIFGLSGLVMGILNANQIFLVPALAPSMYSVGQIIGVVFLVPSLGIAGLAWGVVIGAGLHLIIQLPTLFRLKSRYWFNLGLKLPAVGEVLRLMGPRLFGVAIVQLNFVVNIMIAISLPEGSVAALSLGFALMLMPQAAVAQSVATAAMPTFSAQVARGRLDEMRDALAASLRSVLLLAFPAAVGLMILCRPLVAMLYEHGESFTSQSTNLVAWALLWYAVGLVSHSLVEVVSRAFYALHDTRTPVTIGVVAMSLNIVLSFVFAALFRRLGWAPHGGLALSSTVATTIEAVALLVFLRRRMGGINGERVWLGFIQAAVASTAMAVGLYFWMMKLDIQSNTLVTLGGIGIGVAIYALGMLALRVGELRSLANLAGRFLKKNHVIS